MAESFETDLSSNPNPTRVDVDNFLIDMRLAGTSPMSIALAEDAFKNLIVNILKEQSLEDEALNYEAEEKERIIKKTIAMRCFTFHGVTGNVLIRIKDSYTNKSDIQEVS